MMQRRYGGSPGGTPTTTNGTNGKTNETNATSPLQPKNGPSIRLKPNNMKRMNRFSGRFNKNSKNNKNDNSFWTSRWQQQSPTRLIFWFIILPIVVVGLLVKNLIQTISSHNYLPLEQDDDKLRQSACTVVSSYFPMESKFPQTDINEWLDRLLSIEDSLIIFTSNDMIDYITQRRQHALDGTKIVPLSYQDFPFAKDTKRHPISYWEEQAHLDPVKSHGGVEEIWVWLSKTWFLQQATMMDPFSSSLSPSPTAPIGCYVYIDFSSFKSKVGAWWKNKQIAQHPEIVPSDHVLFMAHHKPNIPTDIMTTTKSEGEEDVEIEERRKQFLFMDNRLDPKIKEHYYHSNALIAGNRKTIARFHAAFLQTLDDYEDYNNNIINKQIIMDETNDNNSNDVDGNENRKKEIASSLFVGDDNLIAQSTCLRHSNLCAYVESSKVHGDTKFHGLRAFLYHGSSSSNIELWYPPKL